MTIIDGKTQLYGILGHPVSHSLSPKIHNLAFDHFKINAVYLPLSVSPKSQDNIIKSLNTLNIKGANVTLPYKTLIIDQLDYVDQYALKIKSVNSIVKTERGWEGFSTDGTGFINALNQLKVNIPKSKFLLLGAGGAAKAVAFSLYENNAAKVYIKNRSLDKAQFLVAELSKYYGQVDIFDTKKDIDVLINATSLGMDGTSLVADQQLINQAKVVVDLIYSPLMSPLLKYAKKQGKIIQNGLPMLIYQAQAAFKIWTGQIIPVSLLNQTLNNPLD